MTKFTDAERARLVAILGMLGSDFEGERASAGLLASRLIGSAGLTWSDVVSTSPASPGTGITMDRGEAEELCARYAEFLTPWEAEFLAGIRRWRRLTSKQTETLTSVAIDAEARARA